MSSSSDESSTALDVTDSRTIVSDEEVVWSIPSEVVRISCPTRSECNPLISLCVLIYCSQMFSEVSYLRWYPCLK